MPKMIQEYHSSPVFHRYNEGAPVLSKADFEKDAELIFNAGVIKYQGKYVMAYRNDYDYLGNDKFGQQTVGLAFSDDGIHWTPRKKPFLTCEMMNNPDVTQVYDARLVEIDGRVYISFAVNTNHGCCAGLGVTDDFENIEILGISLPDNRNVVFFPDKINNKFFRLDRPFTMYTCGPGFHIWSCSSSNAREWGDAHVVLGQEMVPFANDKIGPAAPPLRTDKGWLTLFHAVSCISDPRQAPNPVSYGWNPSWNKTYCAGIMLLDLENPNKVIGMSTEPLIAPDTKWENDMGYRTNVIFPGAALMEEKDIVRIYYGASDTYECMARCDVNELISLCKPVDFNNPPKKYGPLSPVMEEYLRRKEYKRATE